MKNIDRERDKVPTVLQIAAAWSLRLLIVGVLLAAVVWIAAPIREIVVAIFLALLLNVLLTPLVGVLRNRWHWNKSLAAGAGLLVGIFVVIGLLALALDQLIRSVPTLVQETAEGISSLIDWFGGTWLGSQSDQVQTWLDSMQDEIMNAAKDNGATIATEAVSFAASTVGVLAAALIMLFVLFFMLRDGRSIWIWFLRMLPSEARNPINEAAIRGWVTLGGYVRTQVQVAAINAIGIGLGALILRVPLAVPIAVLVFLGSFIPIIGSFVAGTVAVFVALVNNGPTTAIIMLIVVLVVMQLESHVLQPWLMSSAVSIHPVAVVLSVAVGTIVGGIPGALFAVPLVSFCNVVALYLHGHDTMPKIATLQNRPGGPPGSLEEQIKSSYRIIPGWEVKEEVDFEAGELEAD